MTSSYDYDLGVIGGGAAGLSVAAGAARLGVKTVLMERDEKLGGDCLHHGCVPSKTLIATARARHVMSRAEDYGLPAVELGPVDFQAVAQRIRSVIETIQVHDSVERFCKLGVRVEFGMARFVDEHTVDIGPRTVTAEKWVIATGSSPAIPPIRGLCDVNYITNEQVFSLGELPDDLVILGGGPIACEMAQAFARLGAGVTLVQRGGEILSREDPDMAAMVRASLEADGVRVLTGSTIEEVRRADHGADVHLRTGGDGKVLHAGTLLVALGRRASTMGMGLEDVGVELSGGAVVVDARMRTSQKHIFACGDVTGKFQFTHAAGYEAGIVISNAVFKLPRKADYSLLPWCTFTDPELASIGLNEAAAKREGLDSSIRLERFVDNDRAQAEARTAGCVKLVLDSRDKPVGVQVCGEGAGEVLSEWVAVMNGKVGLGTLAAAVHPYPTLSEINKRVAGNVLGDRLFSDTVKKALNFLFDYRGQVQACAADERD